MRHVRLLTLILLAACSSNGASTFPAAPSQALVGTPATPASTIFLSMTGGGVAFATTPYQTWSVMSSSRYSLTGLIPIVLTKHQLLFTGTDANPGAVYSFAPPYTGEPRKRGVLADVLTMTVDPSDNVWVGADDNLYRFKKPSYSGARIARSMLFTNPQAIVALPTGQIATTAVKDTVNGFEPGAVDIFTSSRGEFVRRAIKTVAYPESLIVDRNKDLIVTSCSSCFSLGQTADEIALIAPPYTKLTRVIAKVPYTDVSGMATAANGDLFVIQGTAVVLYPEPYKRGHATSVSSAEALDVDNAGNLIYSNGSSVYMLPPPYKGTPTQIYSGNGLVEQIITAQ